MMLLWPPPAHCRAPGWGSCAGHPGWEHWCLLESSLEALGFASSSCAATDEHWDGFWVSNAGGGQTSPALALGLVQVTPLGAACCCSSPKGHS